MSSSTTRPAHAVHPSSKLNRDNIAKLELPSHRKFVQSTQAPSAPPFKSPLPKLPSSTINSADVVWAPHSEPGPSNPDKHRPHVSDSSTSSDDMLNGNAKSPTPTTSSQPKPKHPKKKKKKKKKKKTSHGTFFITFFLLVLTVITNV